MIAILKYISTHQDEFKTQEKSHAKQLAEIMAPKNLDGESEHNILIKSRRDFQQLCVAMEISGVNNPEQMTILKYYAAIEYYEIQKLHRKEQSRKN